MDQKSRLMLIILALASFGLYWPILPDLYRLWMKTNGDNSHCLLVPLISIYLIWMKRKEINWENLHSANIGLFLLILSMLLYAFGYIGGVEILQRLTIVSTVIGLVLYNLGSRLFSQISFPLLFLFFMVPVPDSIVALVSLPLQTIVTKISAFIIGDICMIPVYQEGNMLFFSGTSLEVAEACSGIRSLTAYGMLGFLFAYLMHGSLQRRAFLILCTIPLAFVANLLRVTGTGVLANFFGNKVARGFLHEFSGLAIFAFGFILLYLLYYFLDVDQKHKRMERA
jgi:exosortase